MKTQKIEVCGLVALLGWACALTPGHAADSVYPLAEETGASPETIRVGAGRSKGSDLPEHWYLRSTCPVRRVRYVGNLFIGMGANGLLTTSTDGIHWTNRTSGTTATLCGAAYGGGGLPWRSNFYVVVGSRGTILTSLKGVQWNSVQATSQNLNDVCGDLSGFVATATACSTNDANVFYCQDGTNWTGARFFSDPPSRFPFYSSSVNHYRGYWVTAGGPEFAHGIWRSSNLTDWSYVGFSDQVVCGIASGNGVVLMIGWEGWPRVSTNSGASWFASPWTTGGWPYASGNDVAFGNGIFVTVGKAGGGFLTTPDGVTWTERDLFPGAWIDSVAYGNGTFVVACSGGTYPAGLYKSENVAFPVLGLTQQVTPKAMILNVSGEEGTGYRLLTSTNLQDWSFDRYWTMTSSPVQFVMPFSQDSPRLFYKVKSP